MFEYHKIEAQWIPNDLQKIPKNKFIFVNDYISKAPTKYKSYSDNFIISTQDKIDNKSKLKIKKYWHKYRKINNNKLYYKNNRLYYISNYKYYLRRKNDLIDVIKKYHKSNFEIQSNNLKNNAYIIINQIDKKCKPCEIKYSLGFKPFNIKFY